MPPSLSNRKPSPTESESAVDRLREDLVLLESELDTRIHDLKGRGSAFPKFFLFVIIALSILIFLFLYFQDSKYKSLTSSLRESVATEIAVRRADVIPSEAVERMTNRLEYLELRQTALLDQAKSSMQGMYFIFTSVAAFFGLFSIYFGYRQVTTESRRDESRERYDREMRNLVRSFQDNITTISSLIRTLEDSFAYRKKVEDQIAEIEDRAEALEVQRAEAEAVLHDMIADLNSDALRLTSKKTDRRELRLEENRRPMTQFSEKLTSLERMRKVEGLMNPFCFYVRGIARVGVYEYEAALSDLEIADRRGRADLSQPNLHNYAEQDREQVQNRLKQMLVFCSHFQGVAHKNLGNYEASQAKFEEALTRNPRHFESVSYRLQVMFCNDKVPFETLVNEYDKAIREIESIDIAGDEQTDARKAMSRIRIGQGDLYMPKLIPLPFRSAYKQYENAEKALQCYWQAYDIYNEPLGEFVLAMTMEHVGASEWRAMTPTELYKSAMSVLKRSVAEDPDPLYSVMLYYMLAVCASKVTETGETPQVYLGQARHSLREVPSYVTSFSPISRIRLTSSQILEEMDTFERIVTGA